MTVHFTMYIACTSKPTYVKQYIQTDKHTDKHTDKSTKVQKIRPGAEPTLAQNPGYVPGSMSSGMLLEPTIDDVTDTGKLAFSQLFMKVYRMVLSSFHLLCICCKYD